MNDQLTVLIIFGITYVFLMLLSKYRMYVAFGSALLLVILYPEANSWLAIDWNVLLMIGGTMGVVALFIESKMPALLADIIIEKTPNVKWAIISLALFSGVISAFIDNVATVLIVAPIALDIAKKLNMSPVSSIIAIAISANLQGAATLVGDTTSIMLGSFADMNFFEFFFMEGRPGIFFVVEAGALVSTLILWYLFRKENRPIQSMERAKVTDYIPTVLLLGIIVLLMAASFIPPQYDIVILKGTIHEKSILNGVIVMSVMLVGFIIQYLRTGDIKVFSEGFKSIDYDTLLLLAGLFMVIGTVSYVGIIEQISVLFVNISQGSVFLVYSVLVWFSVMVSAFIDNIPYVATMLPVVQDIGSSLNVVPPYVLYFGLLIGATLGGNITPIGASANIAGLGILRKAGYDVKTSQFMKISIPFTLSAVTVGFLLIWLIWH